MYLNATAQTQNFENKIDRKFDVEKIDSLRNSKDFAYVQFQKKNNTIREWITNLISKFLESFLGKKKSAKYADNFLKILMWLIIIAAIILVVSNLLGVEFSKLFTKTHEIKENIFNEVLEENINELNFEDLIKKHLEEKNYRYVVRLYYLKSLKNLSDLEMINWQTYKTNNEYLNEIEIPEIKNAFHNLTSLFNHIWYGHFEVDEIKLSDHIETFEAFNQLINSKTIA